MGDYKVIAGVSRTLRRLLKDRMQSTGESRDQGPHVTLLPPDESPSEGDEERVNLFLFWVGEHEQLKNQEFPVHGTSMQPSQPPLSLTLRYLLTAHPGSSPEKAQQLLGDAMRVFHDYSIITESLSQERDSNGNGQLPILDKPLHNEYEQIKISLDPLSVEAMTEIWTAFTVPYRLSAAYSVSVVQIESRRPKGTVRLVGEPPEAGPKVYPAPFQRPKILELRVIRHDDPSRTEQDYPYARIGDTLVVVGRNLSGGESPHVILGGVDVTESATVRDARIEVTIPDDPELQPGSQSVYVRRDLIERPSPQEPLRYTSNRGFFALVPEVKKLTPNPLTPPDTLSIEGKRLYHRKQEEDVENVTFIGDKMFEEEDYTTKTETKIEMEISSLEAGEYPVRVRVAGMESIIGAETLKIEE